jgi:hypothetical protein
MENHCVRMMAVAAMVPHDLLAVVRLVALGLSA